MKRLVAAWLGLALLLFSLASPNIDNTDATVTFTGSSDFSNSKFQFCSSISPRSNVTPSPRSPSLWRNSSTISSLSTSSSK